MEIYKIKTKKKTMAASLLVSGNLQKCVCPFLIERESEKKKVKVKFGRTASQWKKNNNNKAEDLQAYWYILTEMVQVTYFEDLKKKKKKGNKTNLCMKGCKKKKKKILW